MSFEKTLQTIIRNVHKNIFLRELSDKIGIYFHAVERGNFNEFENIIRHFKDLGYVFLGPEEHVSSDKKSVFLSFDDNYYSWYTLLDLLSKLGIKATFYVNSLPLRDLSDKVVIEKYFDIIKYNGVRKTLSTDEVKSIYNAGHIIGSHTHSHALLTGMPFNEACDEIKKGKKELENILNRDVEHFSYPFGMRRHFSNNLRDYCANIGINTLANAIPCMQYFKNTHLNIYRTKWDFEKSFEENFINLRIDGRIFEAITGKSAIG